MSGAITAGTLATVAGIGAAGSIGGALISSNAAGNAASQQANAANHAADLNYQASQNALNFQQQQYANSQAELAPYLQSGAQGLSNLDYLLGVGQPSSLSSPALGSPAVGSGSIPVQNNVATPNGVMGTNGASGNVPGSGLTSPSAINISAMPNTNLGAAGSLMATYPGGPFTAPTAEEAAKAPGYQFQLQQGNQLMQQSAAARGNLLTGGTAEALDAFGQGLAQNDYNNVYNQALQTYGTNYNTYENQQANEYNRLAALAGIGQTTANTLGTLGQNASNSVTSNLLSTAGQMGQDYQNAGAANASGIVGSANAWSGALGNMGSNMSQLLMMQQLFGGGGGGGGYGQILQNMGNAGGPVATEDPIYGGFLG